MKNSRFLLHALLFFALADVSRAASPSDRYERWCAKYFYSEHVSNAGPYADPDGDGIPNLLEYAHGLDPESWSLLPAPFEAPAPWLGLMQQTLVLATTVRTDDPDLIIVPQISQDGFNWWPFVPDGWSQPVPYERYVMKLDEGPEVQGVRPVAYAISPAAPILNAHFMRLFAFRRAPAVSGHGSVQPAAAARFLPQAATPAITGLNFTNQLFASLGANLTSNTIVLRGFRGSIRITAPDGVTLIVNGREVGQSAMVKAGDRLALRAHAPAQDGGEVTYAIQLAGGVSVNWTLRAKSPAQLSTPAGTEAGYTPVSAGVGAGGDANVSLPITVSPGIGGVEPKLSIAYDSQAGNGLLGIGFNLGGLSAITRAGATIAQDGFRGSVKFDANDRFALDGARLISVSGVDGAPGTTYEKELHDFSRIRSLGTFGSGPASWTVETKAGLTFEYGGSDNSRLLLPGHAGDVLVWALSKVVDSVGNEMRFTYEQGNTDDDRGTSRISHIDYTFNVGFPANNQVAFTYEARPDVQISYFHGAKIINGRRLAQITATHAQSAVRTYTIEYQQEPTLGRSRIGKIFEAGSDGLAFSPTTFEWNDTAPPPGLASAVPTGISSWDNPNVRNQVADFNGDGRSDILIWHRPYLNSRYNLYLSTPQAFSTAIVTNVDGYDDPNLERLLIGDFNGDNMMDVLTYDPFSNGQYNLHLSNGAGFNDPVATGAKTTSDQKHPALVGDFNGDGRADLLTWDMPFGNKRYNLYLSNGAGFIPAVATNVTSSDRDNITLQILGEFNGDGQTDLLIWNESRSRYDTYYSTGSGFSEPEATDIPSYTNQQAPNIGGDFNGDGLTDLLVWHAPFNNVRYNLYTCTGKGFAPVQATDVRAWENSKVRNKVTLDFNGDGMMDMLVWHEPFLNHRFNVFLANGHGFNDAIPTDVETVDNPAILNEVGDFNGDGRSDVLAWHAPFNNEQMNLYASQGKFPNLLRKVTNGHGGFTRFEYAPMTDSSVYMKGMAAQYPAFDLQASAYLVKSIHVRNAADGDPDSGASVANLGESAITYHYSQSIGYLDGRGFQTPRQTTQINETTGIKTITEQETSDPLLSSFPKHITVQLDDGTVISDSSNTWFPQPRSAAVNHRTYFAFATSSVKSDYEINSSALVRQTTTGGVSYDAHGNLLTSTETITDGIVGGTNVYTTSSVNKYEKDQTGAKWFLGRLTSATVTKAAPDTNVASVRRSTFDYDANTGLLTKETVEPGNPKLQLEKTYIHDAFGNITESTEKAWNGVGTPSLNQSRKKKTVYSNDHRFIEHTFNSFGHEEVTLHEPLLGQVNFQRGPNKIETHWDFDGFGRPIHELRADGSETRSWYRRAVPGANGAPARAVHAMITQSSANPAQTIWYDVLDREIQRDAVGFNGTPIIVRKVFNDRGETIASSNPFLAGQAPVYATMKYDAVGRQVEQKLPPSRLTSMSYNGLTTVETNSENQTHTRTATLLDKVAGSLDTNQKALTFQHDAAGNLAGVTDDGSHETTVKFDNRGNKISMTEPNTGTTRYEYNGFAELIAQTSSDGKRTTFLYDKLGRLIRRTEPEGVSRWFYDNFSDPEDQFAARSIGKLIRVQKADFREDHHYDDFGRPVETITRIGAANFSTTVSYDYVGRTDTITYPTTFAIRNVYNASSHLASVQNAATNAPFWTAKQVNARGQVEREELGNGLATDRSYNSDTGWIEGIGTGAAGNSLHDTQNLVFGYNSLGNLTSRQDVGRGITETFGLDELNRLKDVTLAGASADFSDVEIAYDDLGNPTSRTDAGTYSYASSRPHAVTGLTSRPGGQPDLRYGYDRRGNRTRVDHRHGGEWVSDQRISYTAANLPSLIVGQNVTAAFSYAPDRSRYRQVEQYKGHTVLTRLYVGSLYEREKRPVGGGYTTRHVHYIPAGGGVVAIQQTEEGASTFGGERTLYVHKDHLGSIESLTDQHGTLVEHFNYDAWGRRRTVTHENGTYTLVYTPATPVPGKNISRGFTGHEMLDAFGLVHMNGRLYDPLTGRFLSADPIVQELDNLQNLNRYSYVLNNPLSLTDPSGFSFLGKIGKWIGKNWRQIASFAVGAVVGVFLGPVGFSFGQAFTGTLLAGGSIGDAFRAGITSAAISAGTAYAFSQVADVAHLHASDFAGYAKEGALKYGEKLGEATIAHGVIGGVASVASGGKFTHGFAAGSASAAGSPLADFASGGNMALGTAGAAILGGTASELGGGKFANGAVTGAMGYLYNWLGEKTSAGYHRGNLTGTPEVNAADIKALCAGWASCSIYYDASQNATGVYTSGPVSFSAYEEIASSWFSNNSGDIDSAIGILSKASGGLGKTFTSADYLKDGISMARDSSVQNISRVIYENSKLPTMFKAADYLDAHTPYPSDARSWLNRQLAPIGRASPQNQ